MAQPKHQLRSAFTRDTIRGWVYLETLMNEQLQQLLKLTPGIIWHPSRGMTRELIDPGDWKKTLDFDAHVAVGTWVRVRRGVYKRDVGCILRLESSGGVSLLLVPRIKKESSSIRPDPELFNPDVTRDTLASPSDVGPISFPSFTYNGLQFEHGLIVKEYDMHSISTSAVSIPTDSLSRFRFSQHPLILKSTFPKPVEWIFEEDEKVLIPSSGKQGTICTVGLDGVEVKLNNGEDMVKVTWLDIRKVCVTGDYVEVLSGEHKGQKGWIQPKALDFVNPDSVCIIGDNPTDIKVNKCLLL